MISTIDQDINPIDARALDSLAVAPSEDDTDDQAHATHPLQEAGQDRSIAKRLEKHPESKDAQLDNALDESMDASDPPSTTQPAQNEPAPSSGYDPDADEGLHA